MENNLIKIAFFVEGLTETIYIRYLLLNIFNNSDIEIDIYRSFNTQKSSPAYGIKNEVAKLKFLVLDVEGDSNVLSGIKEREKNLFVQGYMKVFGLRDMYSNEYDSLSSSGGVDQTAILKIQSGIQEEINKMSNPSLISFHFAVMEIEAWFLAMIAVLSRIDSQITVEFIKNKLGYDLLSINPELYFRKPSVDLGKIYLLVGKSYDKSTHCLESLMSKMQRQDYYDLCNSGKVGYYKSFFEDITTGLEGFLTT